MNRIAILKAALKSLNLTKSASINLTLDELAKISGVEWMSRQVERLEKVDRFNDLEFWKPRLIAQHRGLTDNASWAYDLLVERGLKAESFTDLIENRGRDSAYDSFNKINKDIIVEWHNNDLLPAAIAIVNGTDYSVSDYDDELDIEYATTKESDMARIEDRKRDFERNIESRNNSFTIPAAMMDIANSGEQRAPIVLALFNRVINAAI